MYNIYDLGNGKWQVHSVDHGAYEGSFRQIMAYLYVELGFKHEELDFGIQEMCRNDHDGMHFGIYKCFIYSFKREQKNVG